MKFTKLNELQVPTWRWLQMNAAELDTDAQLDTAFRGGALRGDTSQVKIEQAVERVALQGLPADMERLRDFVLRHQNHALTITVPKGVRCEEPIVLDFVLDEDSPTLIDALHLHGEEGSRADVVVIYRTAGGTAGGGPRFHSGFASVEAESGSQVRLIKIQMLGEGDAHLDGAAIQVQADGEGSALFCELGGGQVVSGGNLALTGPRSRGEMDTIYLGSGQRKQDFSYRLEIRGPGADGAITARGALTGRAQKVLASTLDFVSGAAGAKGVEEETVLTLSGKVVNRSVPLLLCGEANVEGAHATSSGRPDPGKLYYLMSRGLSEQEAKRLLVEASFTPILSKLPSQELRDAVNEQIRKVVYADEN